MKTWERLDKLNAYAQAVAWGDVEGEKAANAEAQKAAKNFMAAAEHHRRQKLLITALEQELVKIDLHIAEAQKEHAKIENKAAHLANTELEKKWNEAAKALLETGGMLCAARRLINQDPVALLKLDIPEQGERFGSWTYRELVDRSRQHSLIDLLAARSKPTPKQPASACCFGPKIGLTMNKPTQNSARKPDYLNARKLHLNGIILTLANTKNLNSRANKASKVETLTIDAIKAELDFIDLQLKRKSG